MKLLAENFRKFENEDAFLVISSIFGLSHFLIFQKCLLLYGET